MTGVQPCALPICSLRRYGTREASSKARGPLYLTGRVGTVDEIAGAALFLVSDDAGFMTAADLLVDGGYCAFKVNPDKDPRAEAQSAHKG